MDEAKARDVLGAAIQPNGALDDIVPYVNWEPGDDLISLDGHFTAEQLEAILFWTRRFPRSA